MENVSQETRDKIAGRRNWVRIIVTVIMALTLAVIFLHGTLIAGDRVVMTAAVTLGTSVVSFWFGSRTNGKES